MTLLSLAVRNTLAQDDRFREWIPRSTSWDIWIFEDRPLKANFESNGKCLIVVSEGDPWAPMNPHNRMYFPTVYVDIWADATRNDDRSLRIDDAKDKINAIARITDDHLHRVDSGGPDGGWMIFGTAEQQQERTGSFVSSTHRSAGPDFSEIRDAENAWMGRLTYDFVTA